jgi:hypothetical protein
VTEEKWKKGALRFQCRTHTKGDFLAKLYPCVFSLLGSFSLPPNTLAEERADKVWPVRTR